MQGTHTDYKWAQTFPDVYWHTSIQFLKGCTDFYLAKCGNMQAARALVERCTSGPQLEAVRRRYAHAVLLPIMADSKLPLALAQAIGLEVCRRAVPGGGMPWAQGTGRLPQAAFAPLPPRPYILVDDVLVQGSALWALRRHVIQCGGAVEAVVALACAFDHEGHMPRRQGKPLANAPWHGHAYSTPA